MKIIKFQQGGMMPQDGGEMPQQEMPQQGAPGGQEQDPLMMLAEMAAQGLQAQDCQIMGQVCEGLLMLVEQAMGGGQPPIEEQPQGEPVFKKGGKIIARKSCKVTSKKVKK